MDEHNGIAPERRTGDVVVADADFVGPIDAGERIANPRAWQLVGLLIGALLLAILVAGVLALNENRRVAEITARAISFDVEVEDEGDDVRIAVLNLWHVHRNILFSGASDSAIADFDGAQRALDEELSELESLGLTGLGIPQPARIRALADRYYADLRPAIENADRDPEAFQTASDIGLSRLAMMDDAAGALDDLGEQLADESLARVSDAARTEQLVLSGLVLGTLVVGVALAFSASRLLARLQALYESEQRSRRAFSRALQTKTDFVADASHELRTPLAVILGNAETSLAGRDQGAYRPALVSIADEANRMSKLVDDLLFLARSDAGMPPLDREYVPARWLATRLVKPAEMLATQRSACLTADIGGAGYLEVDAERIEQAVLILVDNAARHSPPDACVVLASRVDGPHFAIEVADRGAGIPSDELPLIFDRFYQVKNRRARKWGASGLGLSIARTIVTAHGGTITAESRLGEGTTMTVRLPLSPSPETAEAPAPSVRQMPAQASR